MNGGLKDLAFIGPAEGSRRFHVIGGVMAGAGGATYRDLSGVLLQLDNTIVIQVRYHIPLRSGGYGRLVDLSAQDADQIAYALSVTYDAGISTDACLTICDLAGSAQIEPIVSPQGTEQGADAWIVSIPFKVQYYISG